MKLESLSDNELLSALTALAASERQIVARLIAYLVEVEDRRLHLRVACSSLFDFCRRRLGLSEGESYRRMTAARIVRRFPKLLERLERGEIHLSGITLLRDHLTETNFDELLAEVCGKTKREIEEVLVRRSPEADVPAKLRQLPTSPAASRPQPQLSMTAPSPAPESEPPVPPSADVPSAPQPELTAPQSAAVPSPPVPGVQTAPARPSPPPRLEPLAPARYKLQLTASSDLKEKLERATELMRHQNPSGDFAVVIEKALALLVADLEKKRLGKTSRPQPKGSNKPGYVSRATRREIFERDDEQCTFVDTEGNRCPARTFLEIDHVEARALGGNEEVSNLRLRCKMHNRLHAEETFGREHIEHKIRSRQRKAHPPRARDAGPTID